MYRKTFILLTGIFTIFFYSTSCAATRIWTPFLGSTNWSSDNNWSGARAPTSDDDVFIGATGLLGTGPQPIVNSTTAVCRSITFDASSAVVLTVNGVLTVAGTGTGAGIITQNPPFASLLGIGGTVTTNITGTGTIKCTSLQVGSTGFLSLSLITYNQLSLISTINSLQISGDLNIYGTSSTILGISALENNNSAFYLRGGTTSIGGQILTKSIAGEGSVVNVAISATATAKFYIDVPSGSALNPRLILTDTVAINRNSNAGSVDFYNGGGTGTCTVEYGGSVDQLVYTESSPLIDISPSAYENISFSGGGKKNIASGDLTIWRNWNSESTSGKVDAVTTNPSVTFKGTTQSLVEKGSDNGAGVVFKKVFFQGGGTKTMSGAGKFSVAPNGVLTMAGTTILEAGGILTLKSDATGTGTIAEIPSGAIIKDNVNVERYFSGGPVATYRSYRLLSSSVNTNNKTDDSDASAVYNFGFLSSSPIFTGGPGGPTNGFNTVGAGNSTMFLFREDLTSSNASFNGGNFKGINTINTGNTFNVADIAGTGSTSTTLPVGNGYLLYYVGDNIHTTGKATRISNVFANPESAIATATGRLNQGIIPVKIWFKSNNYLSYTNTAGVDNNKTGSYDRGFNLVGNPYASSIDWDKFTNGATDPGTGIYGPNLKNAVYVFNFTSKNYGVYQAGTTGGLGTRNSSHIISSGQGFFVKIDSSKSVSIATLTFHETAKVNTQVTAPMLLFKSASQNSIVAKPQLLRVKLARDTVNADDIILLFEPGAKNEYEIGKDIDYMPGIGSLASLTSYAANNDRKIAINHFGSIDKTTRVKLYVYASSISTPDTLSGTGFESLDQRYDVYLIDHYKKDSLLFSRYQKYLFNINTADTASYGSNRFELVFHKKPGLDYQVLNFTGKLVKDGILLNWQVENEGDFTKFTIERNGGKDEFSPIQSILSDGRGNYSYLDRNPLLNLNQYRIKQNVQNDDASYSLVVSLMYNVQGNEITGNMSIYPNPAVDMISTRLQTNGDGSANYKINITNSEGKTVATATSSQPYWQNNISNLIPGTYIMQVINTKDNSLIGRKKFIKH